MQTLANHNPSKRRLLAADGMLVLIGLLWGTTFPLMKVVLEQTSWAELTLMRFSLAWLVMLPIAFIRRRRFTPGHLKPGLICGSFLFLAFASQAWGLEYTMASRASLITGLYVVLTPLFSLLFLRIAPSSMAMTGAVVAFAGLYLLTMGGETGGMALNQGDLLTLSCATFAAAQITSVGHFSPGRDHFWLTFIQFSLVLLLASICVAARGGISLDLSSTAWAMVIFLALGCTVLAFWVQVWAQAYTTPTRAAVIFTLEPVFGAVLSHTWLGEDLGAMGLMGGGFIVAGIILAELKPKQWGLRKHVAKA